MSWCDDVGGESDDVLAQVARPYRRVRGNDVLARDMLRVLDPAIIDVLARAVAGRIEGVADAVVVGGRAINVYLQPEYRLPSIDWDVHVAAAATDTTTGASSSPSSSALLAGGRRRRRSIVASPRSHRNDDGGGDDDAQTTLALAMARALEVVARREDARLVDIMERHVRGARHVHFDTTRTASTRKDVRGGGAPFHVVRVTAEIEGARGGVLRSVDMVDVVPQLGADDDQDAFQFAGVRFAAPPALLDALSYLANLRGYHKRRRNQVRLALFEAAIVARRMSCNYYRSQLRRRLAHGDGVDADALTEVGDEVRALAACDERVVFGPRDPLIAQLRARGRLPPSRVTTPRVLADPVDLLEHDRYVRTGLDAAQASALRAYLGASSGAFNDWLLHRAAGYREDRDDAAVARGVADLQAAIMGAPPLRAPMRVYRVSRYTPVIGDDGRATADNYRLRVGDTNAQVTFASSTIDRRMNFTTRFLEPFSDCCAFVIDVPAGARGVLYCATVSGEPEESEVLLAHGSRLRVVAVTHDATVAYTDAASVRGVDGDTGGAAALPHVLYSSVHLYHCVFESPAS